MFTQVSETILLNSIRSWIFLYKKSSSRLRYNKNRSEDGVKRADRARKTAWLRVLGRSEARRPTTRQGRSSTRQFVPVPPARVPSLTPHVPLDKSISCVAFPVPEISLFPRRVRFDANGMYRTKHLFNTVL